jgi:hypothetical protein
VIFTEPPPPVQAGADTLAAMILQASPEARALFFAAIGLEASPEEAVFWAPADFLEIIVTFGADPDGTGDSLSISLKGLPTHLLISGEPPPP